MMPRIFLLIALLVATARATQYDIPSGRVIDWSAVGIPGGIPSRTTIYADKGNGDSFLNGDGTGGTLDPTGTVDATATIQAVINGCPTDQVVKFPSGSYRLNSTLSHHKGIVLRGNGPTNTILKGYTTGGGTAVIAIGFGTTFTSKDMGAQTKGTTTVTVDNSGTQYQVGRMILFDQINDMAGTNGLYISNQGSTNQVGPTGASYVSKVVGGGNGWDSTTGVFTVASGNPVTTGVTADNMVARVYLTSTGGSDYFSGFVTNVTSTTITVSLTNCQGTPPATNNAGTLTLTVGGATFVSRANGTRALQQLSLITGVAGNSVTFSPGLYWTYSASLTPQASVVTNSTVVVNAGMEDLAMMDMVSTASSARRILRLDTAKYCWFKNVESNQCFSGHMFINYAYGCEWRKCYIHDAYSYVANQSYGLQFGLGCSNNLVEDNIFGKSSAPMLLAWGAAGNVVGYNYFVPYIAGVDGSTAASDSIVLDHGAHPIMNLIEGNICTKIVSDFFWGTASHTTIFRNYSMSLIDTATQNQTAVDIWRGSTNFNVVGNVLGKVGTYTTYERAWDDPSYTFTDKLIYRLGYYFNNATSQAGSTDAATTVIRKGNWNNYDGGIPASESLAGQTLANSLYLASRPSWFLPGSLSWPNVEASTGTVGMNPAQYRYTYGTPPNVTSATINSAGTTMTVNLDLSCTTGAGGNGGMVLTANGGASTATYSSGSGSQAYVYSLSRTIQAGETITLAYTQPGNGIESTTGGVDLASFSGQAVTNNSTTAPVAPSGLTATAAAEFRINLAWTDNSGGVATFSIERSLDGATGWAVIASPAAGVVTYADQGLAAATTFYYRVRALSGGVYSSYTSTANATTPGSKPFSNSLRNPASLGAGF